MGRIAEGLQLHQHLLQEVKGKVDCLGELTGLLAEMSELNSHINKVSLLSVIVLHCSPACLTAATPITGCDVVVVVVVFR